VVARADEPEDAAGSATTRSAELPAAVFAAMPTPYLVLTPDLVIAAANPAYLAATGRTLADLVGRDVFDAFPGHAEDVADQVRDQAQAAHPAGSGTARRLAALSGVALALGRAETLDDLARVVTERGLVALGAHGGAVAVCEGEGDLRLVLTEGMSPMGVGPDALLSLDAPYPGCVAARTGQRVLLPDRASSEAFSPELAELVVATGVQAWAAVPLDSGPRRIGSLSVGWTSPPGLAAADVELLDALAAQCAQTVERIRARAAEQERHAAVQGLAEALQRSLLTEPPQPDHLELAVRYVPAAREAEIGGDGYDAFLLRDGRTALVIGDVTGHDRYAAAVMAQVRNVLRGVAHSQQGSPADVLTALDQALADLAVDTLATAVLATVEQTSEDAERGGRVLRWSNAGHPPPVLVSADGTVTLLAREPDLLLGLDPAAPRADHTVDLEPGATVLLYTDGLVERRGSSVDEGMARLVEAVTAAAHRPLAELCDRLLAGLAGAVDDDVALLAVRTHPQDRPRPAEAGPSRLPAGHTALRPSGS
jgi:serine phosphatase RsbU (regulator of sigma subunit)